MACAVTCLSDPSIEAICGNSRTITRRPRPAWRPDIGGGLQLSRSTTMAYLPSLTLWDVALDGRQPRRLAPSDVSYLYPDGHASGARVASRLHIQFDLWRYPVDGSPEDNMRSAIRMTRQTGRVQRQPPAQAIERSPFSPTVAATSTSGLQHSKPVSFDRSHTSAIPPSRSACRSGRLMESGLRSSLARRCRARLCRVDRRSRRRQPAAYRSSWARRPVVAGCAMDLLRGCRHGLQGAHGGRGRCARERRARAQRRGF